MTSPARRSRALAAFIGLPAASALALALGLRAAAGGDLGPALAAAVAAFRDPTLLDRKPEAPAPLDCRRFDGDGPALDAQIARDFERPRAEEFDDPEGGAVRSLAMPDLPIPVTRRTLRYVRYMTRTDAGRAAFEARFKRSSRYRASIEFALRDAGLPEDLVWLAAIESGFDPRALSPSGAAGLWQFMPETGALYGLDQSEWVDERRSLGRATTAAVAHLRDLYERFHRWDLALAAYNAGFDRIVRAMDRAADRDGKRPTSFAELAAARVLPEETANYVPQIHAFAIVAQNRSRFALDGAGEALAAAELGEIAVPAGTRLRTIARAAGLPTSVLREYNPQVLRDRAPPTGGDYLVTLPAERIPHALATFTVYHDQEIVGRSELDDVAPDVPPPGSLPGVPDDEPLPRRPRQLGQNRLPEIAEGRGRGAPLSLANLSVFDAKLPMVLVGASTGWRPSFEVGDRDPLQVLAGQPARAKAGDAAIEKALGFLHEPARVDALGTFTLPGGVVIRMRREPGAPTSAITVHVASAPPGLNEKPRGVASGEVTSTLTVGAKDVEAAVELAAARVRLALGPGGDEELAALRRRATEPRRRALRHVPYGPAWLALGDALFPEGHPLAGYVVGARNDPWSARDTLLVEALRDERLGSRASITIVGDIDEGRARQLAQAFLGSFSAGAAPEAAAPHPREERLRVDDDVRTPRMLYGWIAPGEGDSGELSLRVLASLWSHPKIGRLARRLAGAQAPALDATAQLDVAPRASVLAVELTPLPGGEAEAEKRLDAELDALATEGPTAVEVAAAKVYVRLALEKEKKSADTARLPAGTPHSTSVEHLRHALRPQGIDRALQGLADVTPKTVQALAKKYLAKDRRVVVTTAPRSVENETRSASAH